MIEVRLIEGGEPVERRLDDSTGEALVRCGAVDAIRLGGGEWRIAPTSKVGVVSVADVTVWVRPKVSINRILFMLGYAHKPGWRDDDVAMEGVDDLVPALAGAFVIQAERALDRGLLQGYTEMEDSLTVVRGRVRENDQLRRRFGLAIPLLVRFDDHTVDIAENQLLRGATELLLRLPGVPALIRGRLRGLRQMLAEVTVPVRGRPLPRWTENRLNERYHVALWLAELILRRNAVDQRTGSVVVSGFLVDMAKVYEDFLTAALTRSLQPYGGRTKAQDRHYLDVDDEVLMKPDLVWYRDGKPAAVVDAKYKIEKPAGFPDADLYQMLAYCTALRLSDGHLVYAKGNADQRLHTVRHANVTIHAHTLDLAAAPAALLEQIDGLAAIVAGFKIRRLSQSRRVGFHERLDHPVLPDQGKQLDP